MQRYDILIPALLEELNLRFAPRQGDEPEWFGGIAEMATLQRDSAIFQKGRSFNQSAALLGMGATAHTQAKNRWLGLLDDLKTLPSNVASLNGDEAIVHAIMDNLTKPSPLPVYFKAHDSRIQDNRRVIVEDKQRPLFYIEQDYLTVSLPMRPKPKS